MLFTLLFVLVSDLDFSVKFNITNNSSDLFIFNGNNRSAHLFISENKLNLLCYDDSSIVHRQMNASYGVLSYKWPDIVNGSYISKPLNESYETCRGPYDSFTFNNPFVLLESDPCLTYKHLPSDVSNYTYYLIGPLIIELMIIIYLGRKGHYWRSKIGSLLRRGSRGFNFSRSLHPVVEDVPENSDCYSLSGLSGVAVTQK